MDAGALKGGFADAPVDAARAFRAALTAMASPGQIGRLSGARPPAPLSEAAGTLLLTLADPQTSVHLAGEHDCDAIRSWLRFHVGCPLVAQGEATFAIGTWKALLPLDDYPVGSAAYPDRSATLIVECNALATSGARLTGPGIAAFQTLGLPDTAAFRDNAKLYPLGLDFYFTAEDRVAGLPRTTKVEAG